MIIRGPPRSTTLHPILVLLAFLLRGPCPSLAPSQAPCPSRVFGTCLPGCCGAGGVIGGVPGPRRRRGRLRSASEAAAGRAAPDEPFGTGHRLASRFGGGGWLGRTGVPLGTGITGVCFGSAPLPFGSPWPGCSGRRRQRVAQAASDLLIPPRPRRDRCRRRRHRVRRRRHRRGRPLRVLLLRLLGHRRTAGPGLAADPAPWPAAISAPGAAWAAADPVEASAEPAASGPPTADRAAPAGPAASSVPWASARGVGLTGGLRGFALQLLGHRRAAGPGPAADRLAWAGPLASSAPWAAPEAAWGLAPSAAASGSFGIGAGGIGLTGGCLGCFGSFGHRAPGCVGFFGSCTGGTGGCCGRFGRAVSCTCLGGGGGALPWGCRSLRPGVPPAWASPASPAAAAATARRRGPAGPPRRRRLRGGRLGRQLGLQPLPLDADLTDLLGQLLLADPVLPFRPASARSWCWPAPHSGCR